MTPNPLCASASAVARPPIPPPATMMGSFMSLSLVARLGSTSLDRGLVPAFFFGSCFFKSCPRRFAGRFLYSLRRRNLDHSALDFPFQAIEVVVQLHQRLLERRGLFRRQGVGRDFFIV